MGYKFREVICPYCDHRFMYNRTGGEFTIYEYRDVNTGKGYQTTPCPNCAEDMVVVEEKLEGCFSDDDRFIKYGIRGI